MRRNDTGHKALYQPDELTDIVALIESGFGIIPIAPDRRPLMRGWTYGQSSHPNSANVFRDPLEVERRWENQPRSMGVGIPTGQPIGRGHYLTAIDVDAEAGGLETLASLIEEIGPPPVTPTVATKTADSFHIYLASPTQLLGAPGSIGRGLEVKRAGMYVVAPPTLGYSWGERPVAASALSPWPEFEHHLATHRPTRDSVVVALPSYDATDVARLLEVAADAPRGSRTQTLMGVGNRLGYLTAMGKGLDGPEELEAVLMGVAATLGLLADYGAKEIRRKIDRCLEYASRETNPILQAEHVGPLPPWPFRSRHAEPQPLLVYPKTGEIDVRLRIFLHIGERARFTPVEITPSYLQAKLGIGKPPVAQLHALLEAGLIQRGRRVYKEGRSPSSTYALTALGRAHYQHFIDTGSLP